jgi:hypothetical protein
LKPKIETTNQCLPAFHPPTQANKQHHQHNLKAVCKNSNKKKLPPQPDNKMGLCTFVSGLLFPLGGSVKTISGKTLLVWSDSSAFPPFYWLEGYSEATV